MKKLLLLFGLFAFVISCSDDVEPFVVYDVDTDYRIQMQEKLSEDKQELAIEISTLIGFACEDTEIITQSSILDGVINIEIKEIRLPIDCGSGENIAKTTLNLGVLNQGNYDLILSIGETVFNYGTLIIDDNKYELEFEDDLNGIEIPHLSMYKIPSGAIWGRIKFNDTNAASLVSQLKTLLDDFGASSEVLAPAKYTNFEISADDLWTWDEENTFLYESSLGYTYTGNNINLLGAALDSFNNEYGSVYDFDLDIYTFTGLEY